MANLWTKIIIHNLYLFILSRSKISFFFNIPLLSISNITTLFFTVFLVPKAKIDRLDFYLSIYIQILLSKVLGHTTSKISQQLSRETS